MREKFGAITHASYKKSKINFLYQKIVHARALTQLNWNQLSNNLTLYLKAVEDNTRLLESRLQKLTPAETKLEKEVTKLQERLEKLNTDLLKVTFGGEELTLLQERLEKLNTELIKVNLAGKG